MSQRGSLTAVVTALLGAALGGLVAWRAYRARRKKLPPGQEAELPAEAPPPSEEEEEITAVAADQDVQPPPDPAEEESVETPPPLQAPPPLPIPSLCQLMGAEPVTVSSEEEWQHFLPRLQHDLDLFPALGLDCEWVKTGGVSVKGRVSSVSLVQMSSYSGLCVLVRLLAFRGGQHPLPPSLAQVLRDPRVLKVGVGCHEDGKKLARDFGLVVTSTVDLRYLALRQREASVSNGLSLKSLAADLLDVSLDKSLSLRCSDWEADQLTLEQVTYAARDAQVSMALFLRLLGLQGDSDPPSDAGTAPALSSYNELASRCQGLVDVPFRGRGGSEDPEKRRRNRKPAAAETPESGDQQVPDPRRNGRNRKPLGVGYSARKSPLYDNCFLYAPDGQPLCTCDKKKAKWYLDKGIGELQSAEPFAVRLLFEPSGRPDSQHDYYLTAKENLCVVCGKADSYIRKNIVPHEYRRHFPAQMKDHNSHDILLLCTCCHAASNVHDGLLKARLAEEFAAPQGCEDGVRLLEDSDRRRLRSAARALLGAGAVLPEKRRDELQAVVRDALDMNEDDEISSNTLQEAANMETRLFNEAYVPHGLKVVQAHAERGLRGLMELERRWRQHFLSAMTPRHLPPLWAVDHNHGKFLRKYGEDLPVKLK